MECLYCPELQNTTTELVLSEDEHRHCRSLRMRSAEGILLSNGKGLCADATIAEITKDSTTVRILNYLPLHNESPKRIHLALGILDNRDRLEFALEKAVELGVQSISLVKTQCSAERHPPQDRLERKLVAALKQCKRAQLPELHFRSSIAELLAQMTEEVVVVCDPNGTVPERTEKSVCICVGPEGGLSPAELQELQNDARSIQWRLAPARLRAETAAIAALAHAIGD